jgi:AraC-like DNA-binding protein
LSEFARPPLPGLDAQTVAEAVGLSPRYINKLFEVEDTSLMRYIWNTRLEYCAKELADPVCSITRISDIAMKWGFNDMSHFSRAFRDSFDMSPRDWRKKSAQNSTAAGPCSILNRYVIPGVFVHKNPRFSFVTLPCSIFVTGLGRVREG